TKLSPVGVPVYSTFIGGVGADDGLGIVVDQFGDAIVTGATASANFPISASFAPFTGALQEFLTKLDPMASRLIFSGSVPTTASLAAGLGIGQDGAGRVYGAGGGVRGGGGGSEGLVIEGSPGGAGPAAEGFV